MKDGRLFESVFFTRGGNQDFGLYADDGTDIGRRFYQGVGHHETGYKRSDGVDIGSLLFDNTEPVQGYITHNGGNNNGYSVWAYRDEGDYTYLPVSTLNFVAHPQRGSGLYSYSWSWSWENLAKFQEVHINTGTIKQIIPTDQSTFWMAWPQKYDRTWGYYGIWIKWPQNAINLYFSCAIRDTLTGTSYTATAKLPYRMFCSDTCYTCDNCGDSCD